jgi:hypothetical protein
VLCVGTLNYENTVQMKVSRTVTDERFEGSTGIDSGRSSEPPSRRPKALRYSENIEDVRSWKAHWAHSSVARVCFIFLLLTTLELSSSFSTP